VTLQDPSYFKTDAQRDEWLNILQAAKQPVGKDTVGAVALDQHGNLAVATSTGGIEGKLRGRVGDSCLFGGGSYANNEVCAASCTGDGEIIMLAACAHEVYALRKYQKLPLAKAARGAVDVYADKLKGDRGIIALESNTNVFRRAYRVEEEAPFVDVWMNK
jgi:beta-aspartyl-peptidase (threonine type)